ncbi:MAG: N-acetyltransferase [Mycolicibacterium cosmeticum]|nr:N-acetyltransferase [Mycolicibacterium cosmeticum]
MQPTVVHAPQLSRFEVYLGADLAGFAEYLDHQGRRLFFHTEIGEQFGGKGLAGTLIRHALAATVESGLRIVPLCPFVKSFVDKHSEDEAFASSVDEVTEAAVELVRRR